MYDYTNVCGAISKHNYSFSNHRVTVDFQPSGYSEEFTAVLHADGHAIEWHVFSETGLDFLVQTLEAQYDLELRFCEDCGQPMVAGYTTDEGGYYLCEACVQGQIDCGQLVPQDTENEYGGFFCDADGTPNGLYYTEWY